MFLSDSDILKEVKAGTITLEPFDEKRLQPASYDILLGNKFIINEENVTPFVDPSRKVYAKTREITVADGEEFILHPGVSVLGISKEFFGSDHFLIQVGGKSSLARVGLMIHNTAGLINPGHFLNITFELCNLNNVPIILRPGMEIAQLTFSKISSPTRQSYKDVGRFAEDNWKNNFAPARPQDFKSIAEIRSISMKKHPEQQYLNLLRKTLEEGEEQVDKGTGVKTFSCFGEQIRFDLSEGFPMLTTKKVYWQGVLHELYWFLSGQSNIKYLVDNNVHIWDDYPYKIYKEKFGTSLTKEEFIEKIHTDSGFAVQHGELPHIYGELWRRWPAKDGRTVDQLGWVVDELRKDPDAHNTLVTSWDPQYLYSMARPGEGARFPICHNLYQVNIKNGKVCLHLYQRSADIFLGVPFNIASYALLTCVIAKVLGREPGEFIHTFGDYHMYENHREQIKEQLTREPRPFPRLMIEGSTPSLDSFTPNQVRLEDYNPHPPIKAELTVSGGYNKKIHG